MLKNIGKRKTRENGEIMLEGMIVMVITMFVLVWLLGVGFLYYQRYTTTIIVNDAATKIAATYQNPTSDIIMGYVTTEDLSNRNLYRNFSTSIGALGVGNLIETNEERATCYVKYMLDKSNFTGVVDEVEVDLDFVSDSVTRKHVELTVTCTYDTPFGEGLELFGMDSMNTYSVKSCAECTDVINYVVTADYLAQWGEAEFLGDEKLISGAVDMINSLIKVYNRVTSN